MAGRRISDEQLIEIIEAAIFVIFAKKYPAKPSIL